MADNPDSFRPDVFLQALKELQKEKHANEQILKQTREEKRLLEYRLQEVDNNYSSFKNKKSKMDEMKKVAECKLAKTQEIFGRMNSKNGTKTITLQELMSTISEEQVKQSQQIMELESNLDLLANQFRHAKNFYTDTSLDKELLSLRLKRNEMENEAETQEDLMTQLIHQLEILDVAEQQSEPPTQDVAEWSGKMDKELIIQLFEAERNMFHDYTEQQRHQLQLTHKENENLVKQCQQMEDTDATAGHISNHPTV